MIPNPVHRKVFGERFRLLRRLTFVGLELLEPFDTLRIKEECLSYTAGVASNGDKSPAAEWKIRFAIEEELDQTSEAYKLEIDASRVCLKAATRIGLLYAWQSLRQLLYIAVKHEDGQMEVQEIVDYPLYSWRGLHLDVSRHFFPTEFIYRYLDCMSALKLNRFHWHLTDDQGWRIESKIYPRLHELGSTRVEADGSVYSGYYTQAEIKAVVAYAASLGIEVIPEIDLPGHSLALLTAYPDLACFPRDFTVPNTWGIFEDILCAGKDETLKLLYDLMAEISRLFDSPYIHIGGDEAPKARWEACPDCQKRIASEGLRDEEELQTWLISKLQAVLKQQGKSIIGWDEILDGNPGLEPIVTIWRGDGRKAAALAQRNGNRMILCPNQYLYFDWKQSDEPTEPGFHGVSTLEKVYTLDPSSYTTQKPELLLGLQANLWTEYVRTPQEALYMLFPRAYALAEIAWGTKTELNHLKHRIDRIEGYL